MDKYETMLSQCGLDTFWWQQQRRKCDRLECSYYLLEERIPFIKEVQIYFLT